VISLAVLLAGCADSSAPANAPPASAPASTADKTEVRKINVVLNNNYWPLAFEKDGKPDGYAYAINQRIDEALPQYEFTYTLASSEDVLIGLETGRYNMAIGGFYWTADREKQFLFPEHNSGGGLLGFITKNEKATIKTLAEAASSGYSFTPVGANTGIAGIVTEYNKENPDKQLKVEFTESTSTAQDIQFVLDGRYDATIKNRHDYNNLVKNMGRNDVAEQLTINSFGLIKSYDIFAQGEEDLRDAYDKELVKLREEGFLSELSIKWFGEDLFLLDDGDTSHR
ncbi:MAG TPA: transporter substrate-binding domain-containing protein, partial [Anaerovoracaceae bacterium]|nr:transporter substrate-binding domain-containing protein [Anaerovoracaceae bacterium]